MVWNLLFYNLSETCSLVSYIVVQIYWKQGFPLKKKKAPFLLQFAADKDSVGFS